MNRAKIFLIDEEGKDVKEMQETPYSTEDILQRLLVLKPDLVPGEQIDPERPCKWLLVKREMGVPDDVGSSDRWSVDHLFLDQEGIPTFVECKRASDSRNRREVVAQMLDYAANALVYWGIDHLRQAAAETHREGNKSLDDALEELIGSRSEQEVENYWKLVESNLRAGKVRLVFVSDDIPKELRRLVEFLNEKMTDVEVFAVEVKQFLGQGVRAVVPRVIGITEKSREVKSESEMKKPLTQDELLNQCTPEAASLFRQILDFAMSKEFSTYWGATSFSIRAHVQNKDREYASFLYGWSPDKFEIYLKQLPMDETQSLAFRQELLAFGVFKEAGKWTLRATIDDQTARQVKKAADFALTRVKQLLEKRY